MDLSACTVEQLREALALAEKREAEREEAERLARWPKCRCGKPITVMCEPRVEYVYRTVREGCSGRPFRAIRDETMDISPGEQAVECDDLAWGACDDCQEESWAEINPYDVGW